MKVRYEVYARSIKRTKRCDHPSQETHKLHLLYRGDGTPWWTCNGGLEVTVPADFEAEPGDFVAFTLEKVKPDAH